MYDWLNKQWSDNLITKQKKGKGFVHFSLWEIYLLTLKKVCSEEMEPLFTGMHLYTCNENQTFDLKP